MCMMFYRRDTHVIEIQTGKPAIRLEDACAPDHFDFNKMAYITLLGKLVCALFVYCLYPVTTEYWMR